MCPRSHSYQMTKQRPDLQHLTEEPDSNPRVYLKVDDLPRYCDDGA